MRAATREWQRRARVAVGRGPRAERMRENIHRKAKLAAEMEKIPHQA